MMSEEKKKTYIVVRALDIEEGVTKILLESG
jgi:hypothetical protein